MKNEAQNFDMPRNEKVVLNLLGIEKNWVYSQSQGWVDQNQLTSQSPSQDFSDQPSKSSKKSWRFWKRNKMDS
jgi:hypothetical protein